MFYWAAPRASARCLLVEDQALIGMALEAYLEDAGYEVAGPFATCAAALVSLDTQTPQVAVIDYRLQDGCCLKLVRMIRARGIPFLVYSGLPRLPDLGSEFEGVPWLEKPTDRPELLKAVAKLVNGRPGASLGRLTDQVLDKTADHSGLDQRVSPGPLATTSLHDNAARAGCFISLPQ
jgi:DNA-binding response OmpR family regulator